jgi:hypothetical protein
MVHISLIAAINTELIFRSTRRSCRAHTIRPLWLHLLRPIRRLLRRPTGGVIESNLVSKTDGHLFSADRAWLDVTLVTMRSSPQPGCGRSQRTTTPEQRPYRVRHGNRRLDYDTFAGAQITGRTAALHKYAQ